MKPGRDASKEDRLELHREKMRHKRLKRQRCEWGASREPLGQTGHTPNCRTKDRPKGATPRNAIWPTAMVERRNAHAK